jgi:hypothetical protein
MKAVKELIQTWTQIDPMKPKPFGLPETWHAFQASSRWPYFDVLQILLLDKVFQPAQ